MSDCDHQWYTVAGNRLHCVKCDETCSPVEEAFPDPPAAPELPEGWAAQPGQFINLRIGFVISILKMRQLLATQGLRIVSEKDWAVLEACAAIRLIPNHFTTGDGMSLHDAERIVQAELARREGKT